MLRPPAVGARSRASRFAGVFVVLVILETVNLGCTAREDRPPTEPTQPVQASSRELPVAVYDSSQTSGGMESVIFGVIVVQDGCVYLFPQNSGTDSGRRILPVFPDQLIEQTGSLVMFRSQEIIAGERAEFTGGDRDPDSLRGATVPAACTIQDVSGTWWVADD